MGDFRNWFWGVVVASFGYSLLQPQLCEALRDVVVEPTAVAQSVIEPLDVLEAESATHVVEAARYVGRGRPAMRTGRIEVRGSLSREVIRRVVVRHSDEVLACYTEELKARSALEGRVTIKLVISAAGKVAAAEVASSDMGAAAMEDCVARSVLTWRFPPPEGGGTVVVSYPFLLSLSGS